LSPSPDLTTSSKRPQDEDNKNFDIEELSRSLQDEAHHKSELLQAWKRARKHLAGPAGQGHWDMPAVCKIPFSF